MGQPNIIKQLDVYVLYVQVFGCPQRICVCQDFCYFTSPPPCLSVTKYFSIEWVCLADALYSK